MNFYSTFQGLTEIDTHGKCSAETLGIDSLRTLLVTSAKESAFRKVVQATMLRDRQHGPVIELNRISVKKSQKAPSGGANPGGAGNPGGSGCKPVFLQMVGKMHLLGQEALLLPHRIWKVKFIGESVDDCGGGYSESIAEMCDELQVNRNVCLLPL